MMGCEEQGTREKGLKGPGRRIRIREARQREGRGNDGKGEGVKREGIKRKQRGTGGDEKAIFSNVCTAHAQKRLFMNFRCKFRHRRSIRRPRFPVRVQNFGDMATTFSVDFYRAILCVRGTSHGPVSVCSSQVGVLLKRLNV